MDINNGQKCITLDIPLKFFSLYKMKITSLEPKYYFGRSGKGLITPLGINTIGSSKQNKQARYVNTYVILEDIYYIIKEFENLEEAQT